MAMLLKELRGSKQVLLRDVAPFVKRVIPLIHREAGGVLDHTFSATEASTPGMNTFAERTARLSCQSLLNIVLPNPALLKGMHPADLKAFHSTADQHSRLCGRQ
eukprot:scaffold24333_cov191-Amphora_coffeaeformis.AAC.1